MCIVQAQEAVDLSLYNPDAVTPYELPPPLAPLSGTRVSRGSRDEDGEQSPMPPPPEPAIKSFKFFSLFKWEDRKGIETFQACS
jgi:hypothetical protein